MIAFLRWLGVPLGIAVLATAGAQTHSADTSADGRISLGEVLRVVQFYNSGGFRCATGTEDGYAPGPGSQSCRPHDSDYAPRDWQISLSEVLRLVQFFNLGGYVALAGTEDGFAPVPQGTLTVDLSPTRDATLYESSAGNLANGAGSYLFAGRTAVGELRRSVLYFDVASVLPAGAAVLSAALTLECSRTNLDAGPQAIGLHRALHVWTEGPADALFEEGIGAAASTGDVTWLHRSYDSLLWDSPGGDFASTASAVASVNLAGSYTWTSGTMAAEVQQWLDDPASNAGWFLVGNESRNLTAKRFNARENAAAHTRPLLRVVYRLP
jgi:hypothetical protein